MAWLSLCLWLLVSGTTHAQTKLIDERFEDWTQADLLFEDALNDGAGTGLDFSSLYISDDEINLYFRIHVGREIQIQEYEDLLLFIDIDNNVNTGVNFGIEGADFIYEFGERQGTVRSNNLIYDVFHNDIDLVTLPTVSAREFEISISKSLDIFQGSIQMSNTIRLAFIDLRTNGDRIPNNGSLIYNMSNSNPADLPYSISKINEDHIRIVSYNVLRDGIFESDRQPAFQRIIRAIKPEIICFQEVYDHSSLQMAQLMEVFLPSSLNELWYHSAVSPDIIIVSRYPITRTASSDGNGIFELDIDGTITVIANAHLPCCGNEIDRQREVDRLMSFLRNSIAGATNIPIANETPIFIVGDMNLVGEARQQETLISGDIFDEQLYGADFNPDWDATPLEDIRPIATGRPHAVTWYNPSGSFSAGRLDYLLYTGSVVEVSNAFALNTDGLTDVERSMYNLLASDTYTASDHFPCIMDVDLDPASGISDSPIATLDFRLSPNPCASYITIAGIENFGPVDRVNIYEATGKLIKVEVGVEIDNQKIIINTHSLSSGIYLAEIIRGNNRLTGQFIKE